MNLRQHFWDYLLVLMMDRHLPLLCTVVDFDLVVV
jgi:hypothetical protein